MTHIREGEFWGDQGQEGVYELHLAWRSGVLVRKVVDDMVLESLANYH